MHGLLLQSSTLQKWHTSFVILKKRDSNPHLIWQFCPDHPCAHLHEYVPDCASKFSASANRETAPLLTKSIDTDAAIQADVADAVVGVQLTERATEAIGALQWHHPSLQSHACQQRQNAYVTREAGDLVHANSPILHSKHV